MAQQAKSIPEVASELWELTTTYAKQQTVDPLKGLWRFVSFGLAGAVLLGIGVTLLALSGLRALQTQTNGTFDANWSWAPYLIVVAGAAVLIALAISRISRRKGPGA